MDRDDATDIDAAAQRIRSEEARFRAVAESAVDGIITAGGDSRILYANPAAHAAFGFEPGAMEGVVLTDLMPERYRERHLAGMARFLESGEGVIIGRRVELEGLRRDGSEFPIGLSVSAWEEDGVPRFTAILQDISERRRLEQQRDQKARELERSNKSLEDFAYVVSHDLQSPLRHIKIYSQILERSLGENVPAESQESMAHIRQAADRMRRLINALLSVGRAQQASIEPLPVPLDEVMARVEEALAPEIAEAGATLRWHDLLVVKGDPDLLEQVFLNVVQNAIRHAGDRPPGVEVETDRVDGEWRIALRDTGKGFAPEHKERIFEMFRRLDGQTPGSGVGLALCRTIVERHGGTMEAEAEEGKGATFTIRLPVDGPPDT